MYQTPKVGSASDFRIAIIQIEYYQASTILCWELKMLGSLAGSFDFVSDNLYAGDDGLCVL